MTGPPVTWSSSEEPRTLRGRTLAGLFAAGGSLSAVVVLLPGWAGMRQLPILVSAALTLACAGVLWRSAHRCSRGVLAWCLAFGTVLIGVGQGFAGGGSASASYSILYVWVALYAAMYFGHRVVAAQLTWTVATHASALVFLGDVDAVLPRIALTLGTQIAASVVVGRMARHLRSLADTDPLTGLANRRSASRALARATSSPRRHGRRLAVALLDLDGFKVLNDTQGHAAGDAVLTDAAHAWNAAVEPGWTLARTGGDEFLIIAPHTDRHALNRAVERLRRATPQVQFSVGLAYWDGTEASASLLQRADGALYAAKALRQLELESDDAPTSAIIGGASGGLLQHPRAIGQVPLGSGVDAALRDVEASKSRLRMRGEDEGSGRVWASA